MGPVLSLLRKMRQIIIPKDEYVFKKGEIAKEMYWIIEGEAKVYIEPENGQEPFFLFPSLKKGQFFGEMGIIQQKANKRGAAILAATNLYLASLSLEDYTLICDLYPEIKQMIETMANERNMANKNTSTQ
jgi:CRP-like cAMP-binding protein